MGRDLSYFYTDLEPDEILNENGLLKDDFYSDRKEECEVSRHNDVIGYISRKFFTRQELINEIILLCNGDINNKEVREAIWVYSLILKNMSNSKKYAVVTYS